MSGVKLPEPAGSAFYMDHYWKQNTIAFFDPNKVPFGTHIFTAEQMEEYAEQRVSEALLKLNVREWTEEMDIAWHKALPNMYKAFEDLIEASRK